MLIKLFILIFNLSLLIPNVYATEILVFESKPSAWLDEYPEIKSEYDKLIQSKIQELQIGAQNLLNKFPDSRSLLPFRLEVKELKLFKHNKDQVVSVRSQIYAYSGGVHGGTSVHTWNWDHVNKKFLQIADIITTEQQLNTLRNQVRKKLKNVFDQKWMKRGTAKITDYKLWNFQEEGLVFLFPEYQIGPYVAGRREAFISSIP